jgi:hypothetical protein
MPIRSGFFPLLALSLAPAACDMKVPAMSSVDASVPLPLPAAPATTDELASFANATNAFALDLYAKARSEKGNLALSPFSVATALVMTSAGARGETAAQMRHVLHLEGAGDRVLEVAGSLIAGYGARDQKVTLRVANRLSSARRATPSSRRTSHASGPPSAHRSSRSTSSTPPKTAGPASTAGSRARRRTASRTCSRRMEWTRTPASS